MKIGLMLRWRLLKAAWRVTNQEPDFVIGDPDDPYMKRWWVIPRNRLFNIYLHEFLHSDDDRALHDHPWLFNVSILLVGSYVEHEIEYGGVNKETRYEAGSVRFRGPRFFHRIELREGPTWTLFITGPVVRQWGFACPKGWRHWKDFTLPTDKGQVGKGCD
jgi:hypothetical protein